MVADLQSGHAQFAVKPTITSVCEDNLQWRISSIKILKSSDHSQNHQSGFL